MQAREFTTTFPDDITCVGGGAAPVSELYLPVSLSVVIPTRNEADNIYPLLTRVEKAISGLRVEVIFVDDSTDVTASVIMAAKAQFPFDITLIARPSERRNGLEKAVVEGLRVARFGWVCVLDGDLQHPPEVIPQLLDRACTEGATLVAASRLTDYTPKCCPKYHALPNRCVPNRKEVPCFTGLCFFTRPWSPSSF